MVFVTSAITGLILLLIVIKKIYLGSPHLQSEKGEEILDKFHLPKGDFDSFILIADNKVFKKSSAAFEIAKHLNGWPKIIIPFSILPHSLTDIIYDLVAKNRYKFFGKKDSCRIPTKEEKSKFL